MTAEQQKELKKIFSKINQEIDEKISQLEYIKSLNFNEPLTEIEWHRICKTPMKDSNLLCDFVKCIFQDAEKIEKKSNCVCFCLYGFWCEIPISISDEILVDMNWYKPEREIKEEYFGNELQMKRYFEAKDSKENWEVLMDYRFPSYKSAQKWFKFFLWHLKYKRKDDHREEWEILFKKREQFFQDRKEQYLKERLEMHKKAEKMVHILFPELRKFTNTINEIKPCYFTFEEIMRMEGISDVN